MISVPAIITNACRRSGSENDNQVSRIPSTLSVAAVDVVVACQPSPSHSVLTLTPGRTRNIDQDMEALRLSRQDNPFLQVRIDILRPRRVPKPAEGGKRELRRISGAGPAGNSSSFPGIKFRKLSCRVTIGSRNFSRFV